MISRYVSLAILVLLILVLGVTFYRVLAPFLLPLFLAAVFALIAQPLHGYFLMRTKNRAVLSASLTTGSIVAAVIVPIFLAITLGAWQMFLAAEHFLNDEFVREKISEIRQAGVYKSVTLWGERFFPVFSPEEIAGLTPEEAELQREAILQERADRVRESIQENLKQVAATTFSAGTALTTVDIIARIGWSLMGLITFVMALYYFFLEGPKLIDTVAEMIPVNLNYQMVLLTEFSKAVRAVVSATFLAALAQGLATSAALWLLGFNHFFLFMIISTLAALIPLAGTWLVWLPCAAYLVYDDHWGWALLLSIYGFAFVGTLDNVIRAYVLHSDAKLHPLLAFVSVLGGLQVMGLWGVFIAPIVASCLYALVRIVNEELIEMSRIQKSQPEPAEPATAPLVGAVSPVAGIP